MNNLKTFTSKIQKPGPASGPRFAILGQITRQRRAKAHDEALLPFPRVFLILGISLVVLGLDPYPRVFLTRVYDIMHPRVSHIERDRERGREKERDRVRGRERER